MFARQCISVLGQTIFTASEPAKHVGAARVTILSCVQLNVIMRGEKSQACQSPDVWNGIVRREATGELHVAKGDLPSSIVLAGGLRGISARGPDGNFLAGS